MLLWFAIEIDLFFFQLCREAVRRQGARHCRNYWKGAFQGRWPELPHCQVGSRSKSIEILEVPLLQQLKKWWNLPNFVAVLFSCVTDLGKSLPTDTCCDFVADISKTVKHLKWFRNVNSGLQARLRCVEKSLEVGKENDFAAARNCKNRIYFFFPKFVQKREEIFHPLVNTLFLRSSRRNPEVFRCGDVENTKLLARIECSVKLARPRYMGRAE